MAVSNNLLRNRYVIEITHSIPEFSGQSIAELVMVIGRGMWGEDGAKWSEGDREGRWGMWGGGSVRVKDGETGDSRAWGLVVVGPGGG